MLPPAQNILQLKFQSIYRRLFTDKNTKDYINFNRKKWLSKTKLLDKEAPVILVDCFDWNPWIHFFSCITNVIAQKTNARIAWFHFPLRLQKMDRMGLPIRRLKKLYASFGAVKGMTTIGRNPFKKKAQTFAKITLEKLQLKKDVLDLTLEGLPIGDLVYDTYLRTKSVGTVDLKDPYLSDILSQAYTIFYMCQEYFKKNKVVAIIPSHNVYIQYGIIVRLASRFKIACFRINSRQRGCTEFALIRINDEDHLGVHPYYRFRELFSHIPPNLQEERIKMGRKLLETRLSGNIDAGIKYMKKSAFGKVSDKHVLKDTGLPRILMMLHCFFDSPHRYRSMLFPDFCEWLDFTLTKAGETAFDWYVKPHPNGLPGNELIIEKYKNKFPNITFIDPLVTNNQIVAEGINSIFTVFGTAGHEMAYLGVPVVNAGDNPHLAYAFNFHPKSLQEYEYLIKHADKLNAQIDRKQIEEFIYMYYIHYDHILSQSTSRPLDSDFVDPSFARNNNESEIYNYYIKTASNLQDARLQKYIENFYDQNIARTDDLVI